MNTALIDMKTAKARARARRRSRGMTLIEIMVVVAIISLVLGGVGLMAFNRFQDAQLDATKKDALQLAQAVEQYMVLKKGKCPKAVADLRVAGIIREVTKDPWGNDFQLTCPGTKSSVDVVSGGPDGQIGTEDDIANYSSDAAGAEG